MRLFITTLALCLLATVATAQTSQDYLPAPPAKRGGLFDGGVWQPPAFQPRVQRAPAYQPPTYVKPDHLGGYRIERQGQPTRYVKPDHLGGWRIE